LPPLTSQECVQPSCGVALKRARRQPAASGAASRPRRTLDASFLMAGGNVRDEPPDKQSAHGRSKRRRTIAGRTTSRRMSAKCLIASQRCSRKQVGHRRCSVRMSAARAVHAATRTAVLRALIASVLSATLDASRKRDDLLDQLYTTGCRHKQQDHGKRPRPESTSPGCQGQARHGCGQHPRSSQPQSLQERAVVVPQ
jgi:hypothetical protein